MPPSIRRRLSQPPSSLFPLQAHSMFMPPPELPRHNESQSSSSSGSKRKRDELAVHEDNISQASRSSLSLSVASDFSAGVKANVKQQYDSRCWHCSAGQVDVCHVFAQGDSSFSTVHAAGLLDFDRKSASINAIPLCPLCHRAFDDPFNPTFFFLPSDLPYFIEFEEHDRKRRRDLANTWGPPRRVCPSAELYQHHQMESGIEDAHVGGLYTRFVLEDFLSAYPNRKPFHPGLSEYDAVKSWNGSPMAALHRAVRMLARLDYSGIPHQIMANLRRLQDLYTKPLEMDDTYPVINQEISSGPPAPDVEDKDKDEASSHQSADHVGEPSQPQAPQELSSQVFEGRPINDYQRRGVATKRLRALDRRARHKSTAPPRSNTRITKLPGCGFRQSSHAAALSCTLSKSSSSWQWGPNASSQDAIKFFRSVTKRITPTPVHGRNGLVRP